MAKITRFFEDVVVTTSGLEITNVINGIKNIHTGTIDQIVIEATSGSPTSAEIQLRYEEGVGDRTKLAYLFLGGALPLFVDSHIDGPFALKDPDLHGDLHFYMIPDADCVVDIRIDMNIQNLSGL
jgi:hypothetical protein